jgi:hypothetical protein
MSFGGAPVELADFGYDSAACLLPKSLTRLLSSASKVDLHKYSGEKEGRDIFYTMAFQYYLSTSS